MGYKCYHCGKFCKTKSGLKSHINAGKRKGRKCNGNGNNYRRKRRYRRYY